MCYLDLGEVIRHVGPKFSAARTLVLSGARTVSIFLDLECTKLIVLVCKLLKI
jgi:hypothetical protein